MDELALAQIYASCIQSAVQAVEKSDLSSYTSSQVRKVADIYFAWCLEAARRAAAEE